ncbi:MAG: DUF1737 domain-containing protein [Clostridia bacterium]|nr:DUF1737 domain-containing protein [Clostridia bacterium]
MQCKAITEESGYYFKVVEKVMEKLEEYIKEGWRPQGGINVTYDSDIEKFYATLLIINEKR